METWLHDARGHDVLRWFKRRFPSVDVIALSNYASPAFVQKLYQDGLSCFMRKPFTMQGLLLALGVLPAGKYGVTLTRSLARL
jgi:DNA-binding NarL/FixJ family response regulator